MNESVHTKRIKSAINEQKSEQSINRAQGLPFYLPPLLRWMIEMPYCTECGGKLTWDRKIRHYSCKSCGMTFTEPELSEALDRLRKPKEGEEELRSRRHRDYLDWWFTDKTKSRR